MKTYMPLNGLRWSRNSGSANCDMPQSAVFGRPGGGKNVGDGRRKNIYWGFSGYSYLFTSSLELHYWMCFYIPSGASEAKND